MYRDTRDRQSNDRYAPVAGDTGPDKRSQSQPANVNGGKNKKEIGSLPVLPPKIDRQKKPAKKSAAERLFGRGGGGGGHDDDGHVNGDGSDESPPETRVPGSFHSMPPQVAENNKKNTFDSTSSSNIDSYNKHAAAESGYAYSRSMSQPAGPPGTQNGYAATGPNSGKFPANDKYR